MQIYMHLHINIPIGTRPLFTAISNFHFLKYKCTLSYVLCIPYLIPFLRNFLHYFSFSNRVSLSSSDWPWLRILVPQPLECRDNKQVSPCPSPSSSFVSSHAHLHWTGMPMTSDTLWNIWASQVTRTAFCTWWRCGSMLMPQGRISIGWVHYCRALQPSYRPDLLFVSKMFRSNQLICSEKNQR